MKGQFLFLGTGGSMGVPVIGCHCGVCTSRSPYNKRLRPSGLVTIGQKKFLIDAGPDFRTQALQYNIFSLDAVLMTHAHHDHTAGIDDLRAYLPVNHRPLPLLLSQETYEDLKVRFAYIFAPSRPSLSLVSQFDTHLLERDEGKMDFLGVPLRYLTYRQAHMGVNGFLFGDFAYLSDIKEYSPAIFEQLQGIRVLVISALRFSTSALHFTVDEAIDFANRVGAEKVWLTHVAHDLEHEQANAYLPHHIRMAYDGLEIPFEITM